MIAWHCLQCPDHGTDPKADLAARKHEQATGHGAFTCVAGGPVDRGQA